MELLEILNKCDKKIYILGNGGVGSVLNEYLNALDIKVESFLVNDEYYLSSMSNTIKVSDIKDKNTEVLVIVAVRYEQEMVAKKIVEMGYETYYVDYPKDVLALFAEYYRRVFTKADMNLDSEYLNYKDYIFLNPFILNDGRALDWYMEARDNILPILFNDYSLVDEGPYFLEDVTIGKNDVIIEAGGEHRFVCWNSSETWTESIFI